MVAWLRSTSFNKSCYQLSELPEDAGFEVCILGRSNVGKSSLINALCERKKLAKTSKTPGRTQCLNIYDIRDHARLVDCPGYGFAKVDKTMRAHWAKLLQSYMNKRHSLVCLYWIMDARHPLNATDMMMWDILGSSKKPVIIILNKMDELNRDKQRRTVFQLEAFAKKSDNITCVFGVSALEKQGLDALADHMAEVLAVVD